MGVRGTRRLAGALRDMLLGQIWCSYARWHAAGGGSGPAHALAVLHKGRKVSLAELP